MAERNLRELTLNFAINVLQQCETVTSHYSLIKQLERSATSIGANVREANYAQSNADFVSKLKIALKECYETDYWLELFEKANMLAFESVQTLLKDNSRIRRMLISAIGKANQQDMKEESGEEP